MRNIRDSIKEKKERAQHVNEKQKKATVRVHLQTLRAESNGYQNWRKELAELEAKKLYIEHN